MPGGVRVDIQGKLLELSKERIVIELSVVEANTQKLLASKALTLANYQEAIVDLAEATSGGSRIALRILPTLATIEPVRDYPFIVTELALENSLLIVNSKEVLSRATFRASLDYGESSNAIFLEFESSRFGRFVMSYRPFPGAIVGGYIEGRKLIFEWDRNYFEWISMDKPILPEGKWSLYVAQTSPAGPGLRDGVAGIRTGKPEDVK